MRRQATGAGLPVKLFSTLCTRSSWSTRLFLPRRQIFFVCTVDLSLIFSGSFGLLVLFATKSQLKLLGCNETEPEARLSKKQNNKEHKPNKSGVDWQQHRDDVQQNYFSFDSCQKNVKMKKGLRPPRTKSAENFTRSPVNLVKQHLQPASPMISRFF